MATQYRSWTTWGLVVVLLFAAAGAWADYIRDYPIPDISQYARPEWGNSWCVPTAVGNSICWLAREYGFDDLMRDADGNPLTCEDVVHLLGTQYMATDSGQYDLDGDGREDGTLYSVIHDAKRAYFDDTGVGGRIQVESVIGAGAITPEWLEEQWKKGQDVEFGVGYYELVNGQWQRIGGHLLTYGQDEPPGYGLGGHMLTLGGIEESATGLSALWVADPGRDDTTQPFMQYTVTDLWGNQSTATLTRYDIQQMNGWYALPGYWGDGQTTVTVLEAGWAESPVPEPATMTLLALGMSALAVRSLRRV
jgi:hypothetical protein